MMDEMGYIEIGDKIFFECGCVTYKKGTEFILEACKRKEVCPVVKSIHKMSHEAGVPIEHRKG